MSFGQFATMTSNVSIDTLYPGVNSNGGLCVASLMQDKIREYMLQDGQHQEQHIEVSTSIQRFGNTLDMSVSDRCVMYRDFISTTTTASSSNQLLPISQKPFIQQQQQDILSASVLQLTDRNNSLILDSPTQFITIQPSIPPVEIHRTEQCDVVGPYIPLHRQTMATYLNRDDVKKGEDDSVSSSFEDASADEYLDESSDEHEIYRTATSTNSFAYVYFS